MYFQIENTPEDIRRSRDVAAQQKRSPKEECPRLVLAPFSRPPQVVFDNVLIGASCERKLEVFNPSKQVPQITLGRSLPPGLVIQLPGEWFVLEPETCYHITILWTPTQPTALRETIQFTNENWEQYDVIVVLKSVVGRGRAITASEQGAAPQAGPPARQGRGEDPMDALRNASDVNSVIGAFRSLQSLTRVFPTQYRDSAARVAGRVHALMAGANRSAASVALLTPAAAVLVNLARCAATGPHIYARDRVPPILKYMMRFSNTETHLFCILCTYLWLFAKYDDVREDLTQLLHNPENHKMLVTIKRNVVRMKRMTANAIRNKYSTPQPSQAGSIGASSSSGRAALLPARQPDYGVAAANQPRYFLDPLHAIDCLFSAYNL